MKKMLIIFVLLQIKILAYASDSSLEVIIRNISNSRGSVNIGLYDSVDGYISENPMTGARLKSDSGSMIHVFKDIAPGTYAIKIFHDENENTILDKNIFGIPKESYGFSNNVSPAFRGANFEEAKFQFPDTQSLIINLE